MNVALPSAQQALHFSTVDRQWVVTAYTLAFGSLLLLGGGSPTCWAARSRSWPACRFRGRLGHRRRLGQLHHADHRAGLPGRVRRAAGAVGAVAADHHVHRAEGPRPGVRRLRGDRRAARRWLLGGALTEYLSWRYTLYVNLISRRGRRSPASACCCSASRPRLSPGWTSPRPAGLRCPVLPGLRLLQRGRAQLARAVHLGVPGCRGGAWRRVRGVAGEGGPPAAAAPRGARPQPGRRLRLDAHRLGRAVRDLLVPDVLPAADARVLAAGDWRGVSCRSAAASSLRRTCPRPC